MFDLVLGNTGRGVVEGDRHPVRDLGHVDPHQSPFVSVAQAVLQKIEEHLAELVGIGLDDAAALAALDPDVEPTGLEAGPQAFDTFGDQVGRLDE